MEDLEIGAGVCHTEILPDTGHPEKVGITVVTKNAGIRSGLSVLRRAQFHRYSLRLLRSSHGDQGNPTKRFN